MRASVKTNGHVVDLLFTLALFCVFTASSLMVVLIGANVYKNTVGSMTKNYDMRTSLTYLSQKVRQNDVADGIYIKNFDDTTALVLEQSYNNSEYQTLIYFDDGYIKELFTRKNNTVNLDNGNEIMAVSDFKIECDNSGIYTFTITDKSGTSTSVKSFSRCNALVQKTL